MRRIVVPAAIAVALLAVGCSSHPAASHHGARARASISQAVKSPDVRKAEQHAESLIISCAAKVPVHLAHPVRTAESILHCAAPAQSKAVLDSCARKVVLDNHTEAADLKGLAGCIDGVKPR